MAAGADGGVQFIAGVHMLDDRLVAGTPLTLGHAFLDIFDTMTIPERNAVARCIIGFVAAFPQRRTRSADFDDPVGTTITAGRDTPERSRHFHYFLALHRARLMGDQAGHDALARFWRLMMHAGGHSEWQVQQTAPANTCAGQCVSIVNGGGAYLSVADSLAHAAIYFFLDTPAFNSSSWTPATYAVELADLQQMRFQPCLEACWRLWRPWRLRHYRDDADLRARSDADRCAAADQRRFGAECHRSSPRARRGCADAQIIAAYLAQQQVPHSALGFVLVHLSGNSVRAASHRNLQGATLIWCSY